MTVVAPVLLAGAWGPSRERLDTIGATNPATREPMPERYPVSGRADVIAALEAGDIISTGTPEGVILGRADKMWLKPGDEVTVEISRLGRLTNPMVAER